MWRWAGWASPAGAIKPLTGIVTDVQIGAAAADRLTELLASQPEPGHGHKLARLPRHARSIEFKGVTLQYASQPKPAVEDVSLNIAHGETVAFVGPNGCGKTSLLSLVPRLYDPDAGMLLIDGNNVRDFSVRSLRRQIGVVTQETVLFSGTIRQNISYGTRRPAKPRSSTQRRGRGRSVHRACHSGSIPQSRSKA